MKTAKAKTNLPDESRTSSLYRLAAPVAIVFVVLLLELFYVSRPAYVWDETYYFAFSNSVRSWVAHPTLDEATINAAFREGNAHPPLPLYAMALTGQLFQADRGDFLLAVRLATAFEFAGLALLVYFFVKKEAGAAAGWFAVVLTVFSPRLFAHSLLATYDVAMCLTWVATTVAFYRGMRSRGWAVASGFIFGLALLTKVNAFLLPAALWPWGLYFHRRKSLRAILSMCVAGPAVFFAGWPWLWLHPLGNLAEYLVDKFPAGVVPDFVTRLTGTERIAWRQAARTLYFGSVRESGAPWHYPFVMTLFTMPLGVLFGAVSSVRVAGRDESKRGLVVLLWWSVAVQLLVFAFAMTPYDGVRLFLPVLPLVTIASGVGLSWVAARGRGWLVAAGMVVVLSPCTEFFVYEPWGMSYYTPLVGGLPGAAKMGMEVTYYGEAVDAGAFAAIAERAMPGERVAYGPMFKELPVRMPQEFIRYGYIDGTVLRPSTGPDDWDYLIFVNRGGSIEDVDRLNLAGGETIHENRLLGVTLGSVVRRKPTVDGE